MAYAYSGRVEDGWRHLKLVSKSHADVVVNHYAIQIVHRFSAINILIFSIIFCFKINLTTNRINYLAQYLLLLVIFQCLVGILTLNSKAPLIFSISHQLLASFLILLIFKIKHHLKYE